MIDYPINDDNLPFSSYIESCRNIIEEERVDIQKNKAQAKLIIDANSPFELYPTKSPRSRKKIQKGVLLIHGLFDSPFSLKDIGLQLQAQGILCRAILLPGHGTKPRDLLTVSYHHWIKAMRYGIETLRKEVDEVYLMGYSTGALLSVYQALKDPDIRGVILLSPAIKIKAPINLVVAWHYLTKWLDKNNKQWLYQEEEIDYVKYTSIPFKPVYQVSTLSDIVRDLYLQTILRIPIFMIISREDETISSDRAINFFLSVPNPKSKMLLYTSCEHPYPDERITTKSSLQFSKTIKHLSHVSLPFAPDNKHYGSKGDYPYASHPGKNRMIYGAYNRVEVNCFDLLYNLGLINHQRRSLTYNPDFEHMNKEIVKFVLGT